MIKWDGFGKLLKQLFSILLIGFFGFLGNYSNANVNGYVNNVGTFVSNYDNGYHIAITSNGYLNTSYLVNQKRIFMYSEGNYFFWLDSGLPYIHGQSVGQGQGVPSNYLWCDSISTVPVNCVNYTYSTNSGNVLQLLSKVDKVFYGKFIQSNVVGENYQGPLFCFSSSSFSKSACFYACWHPNCGSSTTDSIGGVEAYSNLTNSQNFGNKLDSIPDDKIGIYPGYSFLEGSTDVNVDNNLTGDFSYTTCTYKEIYDYSNSVGASPSLCYGGLDNFDLYDSSITYNPIPGTGKTLSQILSNAMNTWDTPKDWFNFWNGLRGGYVNMWESYPAVYKTWFDIYYSYNGDLLDFDYVREYCIMHDLIKNDSSVLNQVYKGKYFTQTCNYIKRNPNISNSGQVSLGVNWDGVGNMGSGQTFTNPKIAIQSFFDRLKANMTTDYFGLGSIPQYIIFFLMALILFRFLAH